jgi:tetratricopeptide (TPR) repeat protein
MPFGKKKASDGRRIDFDAVFQQVIAPAIEQAGLEPLRADHEMVDGIIHKPMFERLVLCPYAVADLTTANPNVFYELGVRHAAKAASTALVFAQDYCGDMPFDVRPLRGLPYSLDPRGLPCSVQEDVARLASRLMAARQQAVDSPLYQMVEGYPNSHEVKTDAFRDRVEYSKALRSSLKQGRKQGLAALQDIERGLAAMAGGLQDAEGGAVIDLLLSYRAWKAWQAMIDLVSRMSRPLAQTLLVQQQLAFALNRAGHSEHAEQVLQDLLQQHGAASETLGLLGRVYKDRWASALQAGEEGEARGALNKAVNAYLRGFECDWRDAYPGINALTLLEVRDPADARREQLLPVVAYAVERRITANHAAYWDYATRLELAVLQRDAEAALHALDSALAEAHEGWDLESTANNLRTLQKIRLQRGEQLAWLDQIIETLMRRSCT